VIHLVRRFVGFLTARPLSPTEQTTVTSILSPELCILFFAQPYQDQRHAVEVAARVRPALQAAALTHDVGKAASRLGAVQRACATISNSARLPVTGRWQMYLDHGSIGASLLEEANASDIAVAFAAHHPGPTPQGIDPDAWQELAAADDA
jgi:hypothetical protein